MTATLHHQPATLTPVDLRAVRRGRLEAELVAIAEEHRELEADRAMARRYLNAGAWQWEIRAAEAALEARKRRVWEDLADLATQPDAWWQVDAPTTPPEV